MGRTYLFECEKCGYRAQVAGGRDSGAQLVVQTIHCLDCRELHDAVVELKVPTTPTKVKPWKLKPTPFDPGPSDEKPPTFVDAVNRLLIGRGKDYRWVKYRLMCPVGERHRIREWKQPGKCPKCGVFLTGSGAPYKAWE